MSKSFFDVTRIIITPLLKPNGIALCFSP